MFPEGWVKTDILYPHLPGSRRPTEGAVLSSHSQAEEHRAMWPRAKTQPLIGLLLWRESCERSQSPGDFRVYPGELSGSLAFCPDAVLSVHPLLPDCWELGWVVGYPLGRPQLEALSHPARRCKLALALLYPHPKGR